MKLNLQTQQRHFLSQLNDGQGFTSSNKNKKAAKDDVINTRRLCKKAVKDDKVDHVVYKKIIK